MYSIYVADTFTKRGLHGLPFGLQPLHDLWHCDEDGMFSRHVKNCQDMFSDFIDDI